MAVGQLPAMHELIRAHVVQTERVCGHCLEFRLYELRVGPGETFLVCGRCDVQVEHRQGLP